MNQLAARPMDPARTSSQNIAELAVQALLQELAAWPKPGLVSPLDNGSHRDMDLALLEKSARCLQPFFQRLARAGQGDAPMATLRRIGLDAERRMLAVTGGINTHRGAIFGLGLLCAAAGRRNWWPSTQSLGTLVAERWGAQIMGAPLSAASHGAQALRRYGAGGARWEAASGFASIYRVGQPALRQGLALRPGQSRAAAVHACMALLAEVEDTNLLHRGGRPGAAFAMAQARAFLHRGGVAAEDWQAAALRMHRAFVDKNLSPGGCADLLAMTLFVQAVECPGGPFA